MKRVHAQANNAVLRTNDQILSLTDQMNLGVRGVELDTHWFEVRHWKAALRLLPVNVHFPGRAWSRLHVSCRETSG